MHYPAMLSLKNKKCAVVGGGSVALRKCLTLLECETTIKVISPSFQEQFNELDPVRVLLIRDVFQPQHIKDCFLVIAATGEKDVNIQISRYCEENRILVNVIDEPELCSFIAPAYLRRGDLVISISTGGKAPALAKNIKEEIAKIYPDEYSEYVKTMGLIRAEILKKGYPPEKRKELISELLLLSPQELSNYYKTFKY